jgi:hypothetical protein
MKTINEFTEQDGILIETEQESQEIRELLHGMGLTWFTRESYLIRTPNHLPYVILPKNNFSVDIDWAKKNNFTLYHATDYLIKPGDEVEVLWGGVFCNNHFYIGKTKMGNYVVEDKAGDVFTRQRIRKAPNPKAKAIAEIKKIAEDNGIKVKIL